MSFQFLKQSDSLSAGPGSEDIYINLIWLLCVAVPTPGGRIAGIPKFSFSGHTAAPLTKSIQTIDFQFQNSCSLTAAHFAHLFQGSILMNPA
jgi:hypothetical protein